MENAKFKIKAEENPKLLKTINPIINPIDEIKKIDEKLEDLRTRFVDVKTNRPDMEKIRGEINEFLDKRLEWMKMVEEVKALKKKVVKLIRKKKIKF